MNGSKRLTRRDAFLSATYAASAVAFSGMVDAAEDQTIPTIPAVPGKLSIDWRRREKDGNEFRVIEETVQWKTCETAIIICDMWADHPCQLAAMRVGRMAPRMNEIISLARDHGVAMITLTTLFFTTVRRRSLTAIAPTCFFGRRRNSSPPINSVRFSFT